MKTINLLILLILFGVLLLACKYKTVEMKQDTTKIPAIDLNDLDKSVSPATDFYQFATGGWQKSHPLPDEESRFGAFDLLTKQTNQKVKDLIVGLSEKDNAENSIEWKIETFYKLGMDTVKIDQDRMTPVENLLSDIDLIKTKNDVLVSIAGLHQIGIPAAFNLYGAADSKDSKMQIAYLYQGGLGLPNRDYYTENDGRSVEIRTRYIEHIASVLEISGVSKKQAKSDAKRIYDLEYKLAVKSMTNLELRDPFATTNRMTISELQTKCPEFDFQQYFNLIGLPDPGTINLSQPAFFDKFGEVYAETDLEIWKIYLKWNIVNYSAPYLFSDLANEDWNFYGKFLTGALIQQPRWRKIVNKTNSCLGEAVGQIFVKEYFPPEAKLRMEALVENLRLAFAERIKVLDWMSEETKLKALEKLAAINVKIGYPDKWRDYSNLIIVDDYYVTNILRANRYEFDDMIIKIGKPVDKSEWFMNPQTVNAYYSSSMNEICFPAGILQPPFFYIDADDAVNYGAIGVVIGHEMTHGFDDKGRSYDKDGNLKDWWTEEDARRFDEKSKILVERFDNILVLPDLKADGKLSLGENIADYGGLKISFDALMMALNGKEPEKIDGFTAKQRFYLAYAKIWGQNIRDTEIRRRTKEDVHSLGEWRVNGQLPGIKEFHEAFGIKEGDKMYLPPDKWASIW